MSPFLEKDGAPSASVPLAVHVCVKFTDPVIRSEYSRSFTSSQTFVPTDTVCEELLERIGHFCEGLFTRKDPRALDRSHEVTGTPKRRRYEISIVVLRKGNAWAERTFKSYQRQPLTVLFTKQVTSAIHRMVGDCVESYDKTFRCLHGSVPGGFEGSDTVTRPLPPSMETTQIQRARHSLDARIRLMKDYELRLLQLGSPTWSMLEPLDRSLDRSACYPTIGTVLERGNTRTADAASYGCTLEEDRPYEAREHLGGDVTGGPMTRRCPVETPLPRQFFLDGRTRPHNHIRKTSAADSFSSERGTTSSPRVFALDPARYSTSSRRNTLLTLTSRSVDVVSAAAVADVSPEEGEPANTPAPDESLKTPEDLPHEEPHTEGILTDCKDPEVLDEPELTSSITVQPVDAVQQPVASVGAAAAVSTTPKLELGSPILLARNSFATEDRAQSSAGCWDASSSKLQDSAAPPGEQQHKDTPTFDDSARSIVNMPETSEHLFVNGNEEGDFEVTESSDLLRASNDGEEEENVSAPSTPSLSSEYGSSPRYSVIMTPPMIRTHALAKDGILAVSALDFAKSGMPLQSDECEAHDEAEAAFHVHEDNLRDCAEPASAIQDSPIGDDGQEPTDMYDMERSNGDELDLAIDRIKEEGKAASPSTDEDVVPDAIEWDLQDGNHRISSDSALEEASMIQLPTSAPLPAMEDADSELLEASTVAVPLSPTLGPMDKIRMCPEDANASDLYRTTSCLESNRVEEDQPVEIENTNVDENEAAVDNSSLSRTVLPDPTEIRLPLSPEICATEEDPRSQGSVVDEALGASTLDGQRTSWYNEEAPTIVGDCEALPERHPSPAVSSTEEDRMVVESVDIGLEKAALDTGASTVMQGQHPSETEMDELEAVWDESLESETESPEPLPEEVELPPSLDVQAAEPELPSSSSLDQSLVGAKDANFSDGDVTAFDISKSADHERAEDLDEDRDDPACVLVNAASSEEDNFSGQGKRREMEGASAPSLALDTIIPDATTVDLPPSPEIQSTEEPLEGDDIAMKEDVEALDVGEAPIGLGPATSDAEIDCPNKPALHEMGQECEMPSIDLGLSSPVRETETDIPWTTSELNEEDVHGLDSDMLTSAIDTGKENHLHEEEPVLVDLDTDSIEARTRAQSNASDLPSLFSPAISDWLAASDHSPPQIQDPVDHPLSCDAERIAVLDEYTSEAAATDAPTHQEQAEEPAAPTTPYLAAREISDPFDQMQPALDSVSIGDETEDLDRTPRQQHSLAPQTPRRQLTFSIPTPFFLRTSTLTLTQPVSPSSPVLPHHSFSRRSSFSSDRHSISLARDSVDTIDPQPDDSLNRDSVDTIAPLPSSSPDNSPYAEREYRPSTAGWLGVRGTTRRFSMPLSHVWDPSSSERGSHTSRPGTPASAVTVGYSSYKRRGERTRPRLSDMSPRPLTSGGVLETVRAEDDTDDSKGKSVASKFVMLFAGVDFAKKAMGGDRK